MCFGGLVSNEAIFRCGAFGRWGHQEGFNFTLQVHNLTTYWERKAIGSGALRRGMDHGVRPLRTPCGLWPFPWASFSLCFLAVMKWPQAPTSTQHDALPHHQWEGNGEADHGQQPLKLSWNKYFLFLSLFSQVFSYSNGKLTSACGDERSLRV